MKKTILAIAVPAAMLTAGAANASVSLYNADGVSVDVSGAAEIQYIKDYDINKDAYLRVDDADLAFNSSLDVAPGLQAVMGLGFKFEADTSDVGTTENDRLFVGLSSDFGTLTFGRQFLVSDDMGNSKDYELGSDGIGVNTTAANQVVKWTYDKDMFYAGFNVALDDDPSNTNVANVGDRQIIGGRVGVRVQDLDARLYFYNAENLHDNGTNFDQTAYNLEIDYTFGLFDLSTSYGRVENKTVVTSPAASVKTEMDYFQLSGSYQLDDKTVAALGYEMKSQTDNDSSNIYANVTYKLHSNANLYAELGSKDKKVNGVDQDTDFGYLIGMEVKF